MDMNIVNLADQYAVWSKSIIVEVLTALGDEDFTRSQPKEELIENLQAYLVPDVIDASDLKALIQLGDAVGIEIKGKNRRLRLSARLMDFQNGMKDRALEMIQEVEEGSVAFTTLARVIFMTDP